MEMDVIGRAGKQSSGVIRGSVWESRMRIDQVKGGVKVFGVMEHEEGGGGGDMYSCNRERRDGEEGEMGAVDDGSNATQLKRIGARGGKRRTWQPQPEAFEGPIRVMSEKPERTERSPFEVSKPRSESADGPVGTGSAESRKGNFEFFLQRAGQRAGNGGAAVPGDSTEVPENGSWKKFPGSPEKVMKSRVKSSRNDQLGQFKNGHKVVGRNDGANDHDGDEEEEEFFDIKEIAEQKPKTAVLEENKVTVRKSLVREKSRKSIPAPLIKQQPPPPSPVTKLSTVHQGFSKESSLCRIIVSDEYKHDSKKQKPRYQKHSLSDLVMWRDGPKSAVVFGLGTLIIISSSYLNDPNMCFISTISYLGLACLSAIFLYKSIVWSGYVDIDDASFVELGEEEALCLAKMVLPFLNDSLRISKALLSGDPATTMKLAVVLFVLARCGSFITMWNMFKLGFFSVFIVPKLWSLYSTELADHGEYLIQVSQDTWDSCRHKKAVAAVVIVLVLGFSSNFARIWAGFMLLVAFRYYQQSLARGGCSKSNGGAEEGQRQHSIHRFAK